MPLLERLENDPLARHLGVELLEVKAGYARARMALEPFHRNAFGLVHGGAIFGLADCVFQAASNSHGVFSVAVQASISYFRAPDGNVLFAEATEVSRTNRLAHYSIRITQEGDALIALFQGFVYRRPDKSPPDAASDARGAPA